MTAVQNTAKRLRALIQQKGITYAELERLSGVPKSAIQRYASGETKKIPLDRIFLISEALGVSPYELAGDDKPWGTDQSLGLEYARWEFGTRNPLPEETKDKQNDSSKDEDEEYWEWREDMRRNPEKRTMFDLTKNASRSQMREINAFIRGLRASNDYEEDPD